MADIFGSIGSQPMMPSMGQQPVMTPVESFIPFFEDSSMRIELTMKRNPMNNQDHTLKAFFSNKVMTTLLNVSL
jgi:hypothetical protein